MYTMTRIPRECGKCGAGWVGRVERAPERCPVCRVRTWGVKAKDPEVKKRGGCRHGEVEEARMECRACVEEEAAREHGGGR